MYVVMSSLASHIDTTVLADGTYELILDSEGGDLEAQVNTAALTEAPDQSSEEPTAEIVATTEKASPGHNLYFKLLSFIVITYLCIYSSKDLNWNPRCMILGTYVLNTRPEFE